MKIAWPLVKPRLIWVLLMGGLGLSVFNALFYMSAHYTTALNLGIIQSIMPAMILLGSLLVWKIKITKLQIVGLCLTFAGAVFIITKGQPIKILSLSLNLGDLLMLTACIFYAGYTVGLKGRPNISGTVMMAYFSIAALLMTLPLVIIEAIFFKSVYPTQHGLLIIAYIAFVPSFLSQIFFMRGVDVIGPNSSGLYANLVPIFSTILSVLILNEALQSFHLVSLVMVFCGIYIFEIKAQRKIIN
jgi:drug/metabolite transporter (DMT)-like permease